LPKLKRRSAFVVQCNYLAVNDRVLYTELGDRIGYDWELLTEQRAQRLD
jgi:hypothetical protein